MRQVFKHGTCRDIFLKQDGAQFDITSFGFEILSAGISDFWIGLRHWTQSLVLSQDILLSNRTGHSFNCRNYFFRGGHFLDIILGHLDIFNNGFFSSTFPFLTVTDLSSTFILHRMRIVSSSIVLIILLLQDIILDIFRTHF